MGTKKRNRLLRPCYFSDSGSCVVLKIVSAFSTSSAKTFSLMAPTSEFVKGKTLENISLDKKHGTPFVSNTSFTIFASTGESNVRYNTISFP